MPSFRRVALAAAVVSVLAGAAAVVVDGEALDSVLGFVAGSGTALLLAGLAGAVLQRHRLRRCADTARLDALQPLDAARRDDG